MSTTKRYLDVVDYALLVVLIVLILGSAFGLIVPEESASVREWITILLVAFGFKKAPQLIGG